MLQYIWDVILGFKPYINHWNFWGTLTGFVHIYICTYFSYKDLKKHKNKIQKDWYPSLSDILELAIPQTLIILSLNGLSWVHFFIYPNYRQVLPEYAPTIYEFCWKLIFSLLFGDFLVYIEHILQHRVPFLRKNVHYVHHKYSAVFSWAGLYVHPIEIFIVIMCQLIPLWLIQAHPLIIWTHMIIWTILLDEEHSGYDEWWSPSNLITTIGGGAAPHDIHHYNPNYNFGFICTYWDKLFNTYINVKYNDNKKVISSNPYIPPFKKNMRKNR